MRSFYYRPGRNAATALISGSMAALSGWWWWTDGDILWMVSMVTLGIAALKGAIYSMNTEPALKFDDERLWVRTPFGKRVVPWSQVYGISLQTMTKRFLGIIPIRRVETLCVSVEGGSLGARRLRVPAASIELPVGGVSALVQILRNAQLAAVAATGVAPAGAGQQGWGQSESPIASDEAGANGFDPDAAIARYLASKEKSATAAAVSVAPAAASVQPIAPQRPVFGRRQAS